MLTCVEPEFLWNDLLGWSTCTGCGRTAWYHEQANIVGDMANHMKMLRTGGDLRDYPPSMFTTEEYQEKYIDLHQRPDDDKM